MRVFPQKGEILEFLTQFFATLAQQLYLKLFHPKMLKRSRAFLSLLVPPGIALASYLDSGKWVSASVLGTWGVSSLVVFVVVEYAVRRRDARIAAQVAKKIRRLNEIRNGK